MIHLTNIQNFTIGDSVHVYSIRFEKTSEIWSFGFLERDNDDSDYIGIK